jgi:copper(I)-binding protein
MNSAVYFSLKNTALDDVLLEARSDVAEVVQLHKTVIDANGSASMQHQDQIEVKANKVVEFAPGGLHVMLMGLRQPLLTGETFDLSLIFREQGEIHVQIPVESR